MQISEFIETYTVLFLSFHLLGVALGLGGATIADTFFFRFLRDFRISHKEADVMQWMSRIIMTALVIIYVSGGLLYAGDMERYLASQPFLFKCAIVFILTINGIALHHFVSPRLVHLSFSAIHPSSNPRIHRLRKIAFAMGAVSVTSWYTVFFTAMLKSLIPATVSVWQMLLFYVVVLIIAVIGSQIVERHLHRKSSKA